MASIHSKRLKPKTITKKIATLKYTVARRIKIPNTLQTILGSILYERSFEFVTLFAKYRVESSMNFFPV